MNEYTKIRNAHDRAVILAQLVNADARAMQAAAECGTVVGYADHAARFHEARDELWKLIGPAEESEASE